MDCCSFTGVFLDSARDLIPIPVASEDALLKRWELTVQDAHAVGLTAMHDALLDPYTIGFFHKYALFLIDTPVPDDRQSSKEGSSSGKYRFRLIAFTFLRMNVQLRVYGMRYFDQADAYWGNTSEKILGAGNGRFTLRSVKFVVDGEPLFCYQRPFIKMRLAGALRSGGAAVRLFSTTNFKAQRLLAIRTLCR
jgi:hypothetical protein